MRVSLWVCVCVRPDEELREILSIQQTPGPGCLRHVRFLVQVFLKIGGNPLRGVHVSAKVPRGMPRKLFASYHALLE